MRLPALFATLGLLLAVGAVDAADSTALPAFHAEYQVLRNGKELGQATLELKPAAGGDWEFVNQTRGTKGMATVLGVDVQEHSRFRWRAGLPEGLHYDYAQKVAFKSHKRSIDFDWAHGSAATREKAETWDVALEPGAMDRNLVVLALSAELRRDAKDLGATVVEKDRLEQKRYVRAGTETLHLPAGDIRAVRLERQRDGDVKRITTWHAPDRQFLPVQIEQQEKNGEIVTLRLISLQIR